MPFSSATLKSKISTLPKSPGVYEFRDKKGKILYIGKATSLRDRVRSYFRGLSEGSTFGAPKIEPSRPQIEPMIAQIADIKIHPTDSVLEALILESNLIKKHQPKYNVMAKDDKSFAYAVITKEEFPRVLVVRETDLQKFPISNFQLPRKSQIPNPKILNTRYKIPYAKFYGPYTSKKQLETALKIIRKIFPYHSAKKATSQCCFDHQIGRCPGPYVGAISRKDYMRNIRGVQMILEGKKKSLIKKLEKEMKEYAKKNEFEKAAETRDQIFALQHIRDVALISEDSPIFGRLMFKKDIGCPLRIEAYDISNIGGDYAVGSMVVFSGNNPEKSQYRKFKIKTLRGINDVAMMREILTRRFQNNWPKPDLILLDGGKGHLRMAERLLRELKLELPVIAVAKGPTRKISNFKFQISNEISKLQAQKLKNIFGNKLLLARIMDEAHRFAVRYHQKLRRREWRSL